MIDLDDVTRCPRGPACAACGACEDLAVVTASTMVGVLCLTVCARCGDAGTPPPLPSLAEAVERTMKHCHHLSITVDQMAAQLQQEEEA